MCTFPLGHYVKTLGTAGELATESEVLLVEHDIPKGPFAPAIMAEMPSLPWEPSASERARRTDFRGKRVVSIDPPGCTDIDDALHVERLPSGNLEVGTCARRWCLIRISPPSHPAPRVGVHIADVTHFVKALSATDTEAAHRCTTVYLVDRRIDMLPEILGSNIRSAFSLCEMFSM